MIKKGYYANKGLSLAWDFKLQFLCAPNLWSGVLKKNFFYDLILKGAMEKYESCLPV